MSCSSAALGETLDRQALKSAMFARGLTISSCAWLIALLYFSSDGGMSVCDVLGLGYAWLALAISWIVTFFVLRSRKVSFGPAGRVLVPLVLAIGGFLYFTEGAIYLRLLGSKGALEAYVASAQRGHRNSRQPVRIGLFKVLETETLSDGTVRMITAECMFDECGLAFAPRGIPPVIGEDSYEHLGGAWWRWSRSW